MKMLTEATKYEFYQALIDKNSEYENVFYVGVKTTGVFCRPTCPAKNQNLRIVNPTKLLRRHCLLNLGLV
jgi:methylphosphotriester-DNA--protein-cysteine methyltransferase